MSLQKNENNDSEIEKTKYPSARLMLEVIVKEYEFETNRKNSIESRAGVLLTLVGGLLALMPNLLSLPDFNKLLIYSYKDLILPSTILLLFIFSFILLLLSITYFVKSLSTKNYQRLSYEGFNVKNAAAYEDDVAISIVCQYSDTLRHNIIANDDKVKYFNKAIKCFEYALIIEAIIFLLNLF